MEVTRRPRTFVPLLFQGTEILLCLLGEKFGDHMTILADDPLGGTEGDQLVRLEVDGDLSSDLLGIDAEAFASDRETNRRDQHDGVLFKLTTDAIAVDAAHLAAVAVVDAIIMSNCGSFS